MKPVTRKRSLRGLDLTNFFLADVRDGIGPFLGIYLLSKHWNLADIGLVSSIATLAGVVAQTPAGAFTDSVRNKKRVIAIASVLIGVGTALILLKANLVLVSISQVIVGMAAAFIAPSIAGITLGLVRYKKLDGPTCRNEMFNHGGNVVSALISGLIGHFIGLGGIFVFTLALALVSMLSVQLIDNKEIDYDLSRGKG